MTRRTYESHFIFVHGVVNTTSDEGISLRIEMDFLLRIIVRRIYRIEFDRFW